MGTTFNKAIAALLVPLIVQGLGHFGLNADPAFVDALTVVLTGIIVYLTPNKPAA